MQGLLPRDAGEITWNGQVVADPASFFVPPRSAYTAQVPHLFSETVKDNILMGLPVDEAGLQKAIRAAVLERDVQEWPQGLETLIGPRGTKLSGGQAQRTAAARMFVRRPQLLIFDDLSSALDVETEQELYERMKDEGGRMEEKSQTHFDERSGKDFSFPSSLILHPLPALWFRTGGRHCAGPITSSC